MTTRPDGKARGIAILVQQQNLLRVLVHVPRCRRLVRNHAAHPLGRLGVEPQTAHLNLKEHIEETVGRTRRGEWRKVQTARLGVGRLLDQTPRRLGRMQAHQDRSQRTGPRKLHVHHLGLNVVQTVPVVVAGVAFVGPLEEHVNRGRTGERNRHTAPVRQLQLHHRRGVREEVNLHSRRRRATAAEREGAVRVDRPLALAHFILPATTGAPRCSPGCNCHVTLARSRTVARRNGRLTRRGVERGATRLALLDETRASRLPATGTVRRGSAFARIVNLVVVAVAQAVRHDRPALPLAQLRGHVLLALSTKAAAGIGEVIGRNQVADEGPSSGERRAEQRRTTGDVRVNPVGRQAVDAGGHADRRPVVGL